MAEDIIIRGTSKKEKYESLLPQIEALIFSESDTIANLANCCAAIKFGMGFFWVGFYIVKGDELVLGPFQGPVACTRIARGKGVCGAAWEQKKIIVVEDVDTFPGHIACSSLSKSEIVLPGFDDKEEVIFVLDVDDDNYSRFDEVDAQYLGRVVAMLENKTKNHANATD